MTGFGRGIFQSELMKTTVEIKSLNSKQLDLMMRVPSALKEIEAPLRNRIAQQLERGKIELTISVECIGGDTASELNTEVLGHYIADFRRASAELAIPEPADWWGILTRLPDALHTVHHEVGQAETDAAMTAAEEAMAALTAFRLAEGSKLYSFFTSAIAEIEALLSTIGPMEKERVPKIRQRLEEQLARLDSVEFDKGRLEQELIYYIEKLDITEEKTRLRSHLSYFLETLGSPEATLSDRCGGQGKKLGFIAQEMGREINTLGSKSNHAGMQQTVVKMKDVLEQIKEQVLNVL